MSKQAKVMVLVGTGKEAKNIEKLLTDKGFGPFDVQDATKAAGYDDIKAFVIREDASVAWARGFNHQRWADRAPLLRGGDISIYHARELTGSAYIADQHIATFPQPRKRTVTMDEIAREFGIPVSQLQIEKG